MTCTDPETVRRLEAESPTSDQWSAHLESCPSCRGFFGAAALTAAADPLETHPAADALRAFDEEPDSLTPGARTWIGAHLLRCDACSAALAAVPAEPLPPRRPRLRAWPIAAAAGWILAAILALSDPHRGAATPADDPIPAVFDVVLSSARGAGAAAPSTTATLLRAHLVLPEDVAPGQVLQLRFEDAAGRAMLEREWTVVERDSRDWPVLTLDRASLPAGTSRLRVKTPSGLETTFLLTP